MAKLLHNALVYELSTSVVVALGVTDARLRGCRCRCCWCSQFFEAGVAERLFEGSIIGAATDPKALTMPAFKVFEAFLLHVNGTAKLLQRTSDIEFLVLDNPTALTVRGRTCARVLAAPGWLVGAVCARSFAAHPYRGRRTL